MADKEKPIVFPDRDRDKSYIGKYAEVIRQVMMKTTDGSTVVIDLENLGQIEVKPWSSDDGDGSNTMFSTAEDRTVFNPVMGHDVMILELMFEHAKKFKAMADAADAEALEATKKTAGKETQIVAGPRATDGVNRFALR